MDNLIDNHNRKIEYLRLSVTDRCNLSCLYCDNKTVKRLSHEDILRYEEMEKLVRVGVSLGLKSVRITGGEPLVRPNLAYLIGKISRIEGIEDISLTTNGILLSRYAATLKEAGLKRVNISLDTFNEEKYKKLTGGGSLADVLQGIEAARRTGLAPLKINTVILKDNNDDEIIQFANRAAEEGWQVRFIEYMPLLKESKNELVSAARIKEIIEEEAGELTPCEMKQGKGPARYYNIGKNGGTVGFISPMTNCFCSSCNRLRLTADGRLLPCLLSDAEIDIKEVLRNGADDATIREVFKRAATEKQERHNLSSTQRKNGRQMRQIGG
jgi:cyclic pyranopterin phosphate synthase